MPKPVIANLLLLALAIAFSLEPACARNTVSVNIHAPIPNLPNAKLIRAKVKNFIQDDLTEFRGEIKDLKAKSVHGSFSCKIEKTFYSPKLVSIQFRMTKEFPQAAHPSDEIATLNFNPKSGEEVALEDIFLETVDIAQVFSVLTQAHFLSMTEEPDMDFLFIGAGPEIDNFNEFAFNANGVELIFNEQINAYAEGIRRFTIPYSEISNLMLSDNPISHLVANCKVTPKRIFHKSNLDNELATTAIGAYSLAIERKPDVKTYYLQRGEWYKKLGRNAAAKRDEEKGNNTNRVGKSLY